MSLKIRTIAVTPIRQNCRLLTDSQTGTTVIIDPGGSFQKTLKIIKAENLEPSAIWLTHSHFDHCGAVAALKNEFDIPLYAHKEGQSLREIVELAAARFAMPKAEDLTNCPEPEHYIDEGDTLMIGEEKFEVFFVPGHAPDHVVFYNAANQTLIAGDTVFAGSIGRTDLPGGDFELLINGIRNKIFTLPDNTKVMTGHGEDTTIGEEKASNPFFQDS